MRIEYEFLYPTHLNEYYSTSILCLLRDKIVEIKEALENCKDLVVNDKLIDLDTNLELSNYEYRLAHVYENLRTIEAVIMNRFIEAAEINAGFITCLN
jgi:hypothetical protein